MREYNFIKNLIINKHKIDNYEYLDKYINLLVNYEIKENNTYIEKHHILPRSTFPEYENEDWNIIKVSYDDHKLLHLWLFKAINIRKYQRPLNWMIKEYKNHEEISNAAKSGWIKLKKNKNKYDKWLKDRSNHMKSLPSEEQRRRANLFWENITEDEYLNFCNNMKELWTDEKKEEKSNQMKKYYSIEGNKQKKSIESKKTWDERSDEYRNDFKKKMSIINKDEEKRKDASEKIKALWKNEDYLEKMKNRKLKPVDKLKIIDENGNELIFNNMKEITKIYNLSPYLIRKYRDTGIKIKKEKTLKKESMELIGSLIETIK